MMSPRLLYAFLFGLPMLLGPFSARSDDTDHAPERSVDLTSSYQDLSFSGTISTADIGGDCVYKIPSLTIRFARGDGQLTKAIYLDQFRIVVVAPTGLKRTLLKELFRR
jgi:hypothetical protein